MSADGIKQNLSILMMPGFVMSAAAQRSTQNSYSPPAITPAALKRILYMPKQKIDVNENLDVSIGDLFKSKTSESGSPANEGITYTEQSAEPLKTNVQRNSVAKKALPKFGKISLQHQRTGRGGKTVTLVSISGETEYKFKHNLEALLKELKKSLGCGGQIEDGKIVLQGEIADRASEWFVKMGAKQ